MIIIRVCVYVLQYFWFWSKREKKIEERKLIIELYLTVNSYKEINLYMVLFDKDTGLRCGNVALWKIENIASLLSYGTSASHIPLFSTHFPEPPLIMHFDSLVWFSFQDGTNSCTPIFYLYIKLWTNQKYNGFLSSSICVKIEVYSILWKNFYINFFVILIIVLFMKNDLTEMMVFALYSRYYIFFLSLKLTHLSVRWIGSFLDRITTVVEYLYFANNLVLIKSNDFYLLLHNYYTTRFYALINPGNLI